MLLKLRVVALSFFASIVLLASAFADCGGAVAQGITINRKNIGLGSGGGGTDYGHWWIDLGNGESYGWWPTGNVDLLGTIFGVPGSLNRGQSQDPHHGDSADQVLSVRLPEGMTVDDLRTQIRNWATNFSGTTWRWPFGWNCHSFQEKMIDDLGLEPCDPSVLEMINSNFSIVSLPDADFAQIYADVFGNVNAELDYLFEQLLLDYMSVPEGNVSIGEFIIVESYSNAE